jgi:hypothetical protein
MTLTNYPYLSSMTEGSQIVFDTAYSVCQEGGRYENIEPSELMKKYLSDNKTFNIYSTSKNTEKNTIDILQAFKCIYEKDENDLKLVVDKDTKYSHINRSFLMKLINFGKVCGARNLSILIDKKSSDYVKILQAMMTIGFQNSKKIKVVKLGDREYRLMRMEMKAEETEIEDVAF